MRALLGMAVILLLTVGCRRAEQPGPPPAEPRHLAAIPGTALAAVPEGARTHSYRIDMAAGQYAALTVDQQGVDVVVVLAFHHKFAELSADLMAEKVRIDTGKAPDESLLASLWTAAQDARNYVILGDPAVRLPAAVREDTPCNPSPADASSA